MSAQRPSGYAKSREVEAEGRLRGERRVYQFRHARESRESSKTKFEEAAERESEERAREAEDVRDLPPPREENDGD